MKKGTNLIRVFSGEQFAVGHLKSELENNGIVTLLKDNIAAGRAAGFAAGIFSTIDLYIQEADLKKANPIISSFNTLGN